MFAIPMTLTVLGLRVLGLYGNRLGGTLPDAISLLQTVT